MVIEIYPLDNQGNPAASLGGVPVVGPLLGWSGLSFTPSGACIDKIPSNSVKVPLSEWRNVVVTPGMQLLIWDTAIQDEVTRGVVLDQTETVDASGVHWAQVTFVDILRDLVRADVTSGFASSPGEAMSLTLARLAGLADTPWYTFNEVTGFDGVAFTAYRQSVAQAVGKLVTERPGAHFRREMAGGSPRVLHVGAFGTPFAIGGVPLWLTPPAPNPTEAEGAAAQRQQFGVSFLRKGEITNSLTPTGGGNGPSELTLRTLYGLTTFQGLNPARPVRRRPRQDGGLNSFDGFDYYLDDAPSIAAYGRAWGSLAKTDINPVVSPAGAVQAADEQSAAISLYVVADASMRYSVAPTLQLQFTTAGRGDLRNIGGQTVHVTYQDYAFDERDQRYTIINVDGDFTVLEVVRAVKDDGTAEDTWTVSDTGQYVATNNGVLIGQLNQITALGASITTYPHRYTIPKSGSVDAGAPLTLRIRPDNSIVRHHYALLTLAFEGIRHTVTDNGHTQDVVTAPVHHDVANLGLRLVTSGGAVHDTINGDVTYDPGAHILLSPASSKPASAKPVYFDGSAWYWDGATRADPDISESPVTISIVPATTGGTGGTVPQATHAVASGFGAQLKKATIEQMSIGPLPTGVKVAIDTVEANAQFINVANGATLDLSPYVFDQAGHTVTIYAATIGGIDCQLDISVDITTTALTPLGH